MRPLLLAVLLLAGCARQAADPPPLTAAVVGAHLDRHLIATWFPACQEPDGGFHPAFARDWSRQPAPTCNLVFTARMTWFAAQVALHRPDLRARFARIAGDGARFLVSRYGDPASGGLHYVIAADGAPLPGEQHLYGFAFAIYALCAAHEATGEAEHLAAARRLFAWMDAHAHDADGGGYHEALDRDGVPIPEPAGRTTWDRIGGRHGGKSMNCHIHLLEALTALARQGGDEAVRARLAEVFAIVRDRICTPAGMGQWFTADWRALPDLDSYGHDLETAHLLDEAARTLGQDDARVRAVERALVDHALECGRDPASGGFWDAGGAWRAASERRRVWWVQAEAINGLVLMDRQHGAETARYREALQGLWRSICRDLVDPVHGGWYAGVGDEYHAGVKGHNWFAAYHSGRALFNLEAYLAQAETTR